MDNKKKYINKNSFEILLNHEVVCSKRYRRFMTLIIFEIVSNDYLILKVIKDLFRITDSLYIDKNRLFVLMPETNYSGASRAIKRITNYLEKNTINYSITTYPEDANNINNLINMGLQRLHNERITNHES